MKKVIISVICLVTMFVCSGSFVLAEDNNPYEEYTEEEIELIQLLEDTVPDYSLSEGEVVAIYQVTGVLTPEGIEFVDSKERMGNRGSIGSDYMTITVSVQRIHSSNTSYDDFRFTAKADWLMAPFFRGEDALAIAWSDDFSQYSHYCNAYYNSMGYISGKTSQIDSTPEAGVCYSVDCSYYYGQALDYAVLTVYAKKEADSGTAVISAKYAHKKISLSSITVSYGENASISFSPSSGLDTMAADTMFYY